MIESRFPSLVSLSIVSGFLAAAVFGVCGGAPAVAQDCVDSYHGGFELLSWIEVTNGIQEIILRDNIAICLDDQGYVLLVKLRESGTPEIMARILVSLRAMRIAASKTWIFVGCGDYGIYGIDYRDPYAPVVKLILPDAHMTHMAITGNNLLYVDDESGYVHHYWVMDPFAPVDLGLVPLPEPLMDNLPKISLIKTDGDRVYLAGRQVRSNPITFGAIMRIEKDIPYPRLTACGYADIGTLGDFTYPVDIAGAGDSLLINLEGRYIDRTPWEWTPPPFWEMRAYDFSNYPEIEYTKFCTSTVSLSRMNLISKDFLSYYDGRIRLARILPDSRIEVVGTFGTANASASDGRDSLLVFYSRHYDGDLEAMRIRPIPDYVLDSSGACGIAEEDFTAIDDNLFIKRTQESSPFPELCTYSCGTFFEIQEGGFITRYPVLNFQGYASLGFMTENVAMYEHYLICGAPAYELYDWRSGVPLGTPPPGLQICYGTRGRCETTLERQYQQETFTPTITIWSTTSEPPVQIGAFDLPSDFQLFRLFEKDKYLYALGKMSTEEVWLLTYDVTDAAAVHATDQQQIVGGALVYGSLYINGNILYVPYSESSQVAFDISSPAVPRAIPLVRYPGQVSGNIAFAAVAESLKIYELESLTEFRSLGTYVHKAYIEEVRMAHGNFVILQGGAVFTVAGPCSYDEDFILPPIDSVAAKALAAQQAAAADWDDTLRDLLVEDSREGRTKVPAEGEGKSTASPEDLQISVAPNPFRQSTDISFTTGRSGTATVRVFDVRGRLVANLSEGAAGAPGRREWSWNGRDEHGQEVPAGVYFVRVEEGTTARTHRVVYLK